MTEWIKITGWIKSKGWLDTTDKLKSVGLKEIKITDRFSE
jgi:hypothetical protein